MWRRSGVRATAAAPVSSAVRRVVISCSLKGYFTVLWSAKGSLSDANGPVKHFTAGIVYARTRSNNVVLRSFMFY